MKTAPLPGPIVRADGASVADDDLPGDTQPQARPLAWRLGRHPRVEDVSQQFGWNSAAGVFDFQTEPIVDAREADRQSSSGLHGVDAVGDEIEERQLELHRVGQDVQRAASGAMTSTWTPASSSIGPAIWHTRFTRAPRSARSCGIAAGARNRAPSARSPSLWPLDPEWPSADRREADSGGDDWISSCT